MKHVVRLSCFGAWPRFDTRLCRWHVLPGGSPLLGMVCSRYTRSVSFAWRSAAGSMCGGIDSSLCGMRASCYRGYIGPGSAPLKGKCHTSAKGKPMLRYAPLPNPTLYTVGRDSGGEKLQGGDRAAFHPDHHFMPQSRRASGLQRVECHRRLGKPAEVRVPGTSGVYCSTTTKIRNEQ